MHHGARSPVCTCTKVHQRFIASRCTVQHHASAATSAARRRRLLPRPRKEIRVGRLGRRLPVQAHAHRLLLHHLLHDRPRHADVRGARRRWRLSAGGRSGAAARLRAASP